MHSVLCVTEVQNQRLVQQLGLLALLLREPAPAMNPVVVAAPQYAGAAVAGNVVPGPLAGAHMGPPPPYLVVGPVGVAPPGYVPLESAPASPAVVPPAPTAAPLLPAGASGVRPPPGFEAAPLLGPAVLADLHGPSSPDQAVSEPGAPASSESTWSSWSGGACADPERGELFFFWPGFSPLVLWYYLLGRSCD